MRKKLVVLTVLCVVVSLLAGCGWWKDLMSRNKRAENQPEAIYQAGVTSFKDGRYKRAVENFTRLKEQFPLHSLAIMAEMGIADAHFSDEQYAEAELAYTDFLSLHPTNEHIPYVMYQIGLCHFNQMHSSDRDQTETIKTAKDFERLIARFPTSKFAFMAEKKLLECRQRLAENEFLVAEFYFKQGKYKAAANRFEYLKKNYSNLGFDYQAGVYLAESKKRLADETARIAKGEKIKKDTGINNAFTGYDW